MNPLEHHAYLCRAVRPTLFSATLHPEFIPALVLANLMTPRLWHWAETLTTNPAWRDADTGGRLRLLHRFLNKRFFHPEGKVFGRIWGLQERERITDPAERAASDYSMQMIEKSLHGISDPNYWTFSFIPLMRHGQFPLYVYPTADGIASLATLLPELDSRTLGITSCLDECVLAASLALASGICRRDEFAFLGSPAHYTLMVQTSDGPAWFNAKREFFDRQDWDRKHSGLSAIQQADAFYHSIYLFDRIITANACAVYPDGPAIRCATTISPWISRAESLISAPIPWMHPLPPEQMDSGDWDAFPEIDPHAGAGAVEMQVLSAMRDRATPLLQAALCAYRHPDFCTPSLLAEAASAGYFVFLKAATVFEEADADAIVDSIPDHVSILGESGRVALPDEVLAFQTASPAERALLKATLLRLSPSRDRANRA